MKHSKLSCLLLAVLLCMSLLSGCGNTNNSQAPVEPSSNTGSTNVPAQSTADENESAAEQLLQDLEGTYQELWPVVLANEYQQIWLDNCANLVGEENAKSAAEMLSSMVTGTLTGEDAVSAYKDDGMAYCCEFLQNVNQFNFEGSTISGMDNAGNEIFKHSYHYTGTEDVRGLSIFESDDADSGEFTYFCLAPDTMDTTWHIEFRYGSDIDALNSYDSGAYAYWLASGISVDCTLQDIENVIELFCTENLSE